MPRSPAKSGGDRTETRVSAREIGEHGEKVGGPPWILGHRGAPREAPENTLSSLRRALELGLDGVEYDLHACQSGDAVLIHDDTLDRTTNRSGPVEKLALSELVHVDAGGWFAKSFTGEPLPLLEEALELGSDEPDRAVHHMIEIKDPTLVPEVARLVRERRRPLSFHVASFHRNVCLEARDAELPSMLLAYEANEDDLAFVRDERIVAYGTGPEGWRTSAGEQDWPCERWSWSVDDPEDLWAACRRPLAGFNSNEPRRALAIRALVALAPGYAGPFPLRVPRLEVAPSPADEADPPQGEWSGVWEVAIGVVNPFPFPVRAALAIALRGGAFQVTGLPASFALDPGATRDTLLQLRGGSRSPIEDPSVRLALAWRTGRGRPETTLALDAPLERVRTLRLSGGVQRVRMLREKAGDPPASMTLKLRGRELLAWVEDPGGLADVRSSIRVGSRVRTGRRGVRIRLPERFDPSGIPFSVGFEGWPKAVPEKERGAPVLRRWAGGLPYGLGAGAPGRLLRNAEA